MSEIEKMERYICNSGIKRNIKYDAKFDEMFAIFSQMSGINAITFAFRYGQAKGYREAKAEVRK